MDYLINEVWEWFDGHNLSDPVMQTVKINEEVGEICHEISRSHFSSDELIDAIGDTLVTIIGLCHHIDIDPYTCLSEAYDQIKSRKGRVVNGSFVKNEDD